VKVSESELTAHNIDRLMKLLRFDKINYLTLNDFNRLLGTEIDKNPYLQADENT